MVENSLGRLWIEGHPDDEFEGELEILYRRSRQERS